MSGRTFAIGDIHGELETLLTLWEKLPVMDAGDTVVFLGDYVDGGPASAGVIHWLRTLPSRTPARVVCLRGNHEDAWLRVIDHGWPEFILPPGNGCRACMVSFGGDADDHAQLFDGAFFPADVVAWLRSLPLWYEDERAIYVHAGVPQVGGRWLHPSEVTPTSILLWTRAPDFFRAYSGKLLIVGHTRTRALPPELSVYTPDDDEDLWVHGSVVAADTGCGKGGFLTAVELPTGFVYTSR